MTESNPILELAVQNEKYIKNCTELCLSNRNIQTIKNFERFVNLEVLWLNDNKIQRIENLDANIRIKQLYVFNNKIRSLEGSLLKFKFLQDLRLSNNKLRDLHGNLQILSKFHHLQHLDLFGNPLAEEINYQYHVIRAIPSLVVFDCHVISEKERNAANKLGTQKHNPPILPVANRTFQTTTSKTVQLLISDMAKMKRVKEQNEKQLVTLETLPPKAHHLTDTCPLPKTLDFLALQKEDNKKKLNEWEKIEFRKLCHKCDPKKSGFIALKNYMDVLEKMKDQLRVLVLQFDGTKETRNIMSFFQITMKADDDSLISWEQFAEPDNDQTVWNQDKIKLGSFYWDFLDRVSGEKRYKELFEKAQLLQQKAFTSDHDDQNDWIKQAHELTQKAYRIKGLYEKSNVSEETKNSKQVIETRADWVQMYSYPSLPSSKVHHHSEGIKGLVYGSYNPEEKTNCETRVKKNTMYLSKNDG